MSERQVAVVGLMNIFIDPAAAVKQIPGRAFWMWPVAIVSGVRIVIGYLMLPLTMQLVNAQMAQRNVPADRLEAATRLAHLFGEISLAATPLFVAGAVALFASFVMGACSVLGIRARFRDLFSLLAACSLITTLQLVAGYFVIRARGDEIRVAEQLQPPFGLDIFTSDLHGPLLALLNFFSIFELWYIVVLALGLAFLTGCSKGKAFLATMPAWLASLAATLVASLFSR